MPAHRTGQGSTTCQRLSVVLTTRHDPGIRHSTALVVFVLSASLSLSPIRSSAWGAMFCVPHSVVCALPVLYLIAHRII